MANEELWTRVAVGLICAGMTLYHAKPPKNPEQDHRGFLLFGSFILGAVFYLYVIVVVVALVLAYFSPRIINRVMTEWKEIEIASRSQDGRIVEQPRALLRNREETVEEDEPLDILREHFHADQSRNGERQAPSSE